MNERGKKCVRIRESGKGKRVKLGRGGGRKN